MTETRDTTLPSYLQRVMDQNDWNAAELARRSGLDAGGISRWLRGTGRPNIDNARALAHGLGRPILEVMVAAGLLTAKEAKQKPAAAPSLDSLTDDELVAEVGRRLARTRMQTARLAAVRGKHSSGPSRPHNKDVSDISEQVWAADDPAEPLLRDVQEQNWGDA